VGDGREGINIQAAVSWLPKFLVVIKGLLEDIFVFINMSYVSFVINTSVLLQRVQVQFTDDSQE
jgi:hypothetical protein